jgi:glutathione S-transferase
VPGPAPEHDPADPSGLAPGEAVAVSADDYGRDPIKGMLVAATPDRIVIHREAGELGGLNIHFPRVGYVLAAAPQ